MLKNNNERKQWIENEDNYEIITVFIIFDWGIHCRTCVRNNGLKNILLILRLLYCA